MLLRIGKLSRVHFAHSEPAKKIHLLAIQRTLRRLRGAKRKGRNDAAKRISTSRRPERVRAQAPPDGATNPARQRPLEQLAEADAGAAGFPRSPPSGGVGVTTRLLAVDVGHEIDELVL